MSKDETMVQFMKQDRFKKIEISWQPKGLGVP